MAHLHYQDKNGESWKSPTFIKNQCLPGYKYEDAVWSYNNGHVMDGTHNGIDFLHKHPQKTHPPFYAVTPGKVVYVGTPSLSSPDFATIAIYEADPSDKDNPKKGKTTLYLHADEINTAAVFVDAPIFKGTLLGKQGNSGLKYGDTETGQHVHITVRAGRSTCACHNDPNMKEGGYLPPVATILPYVKDGWTTEF